MNKNLMPHEIKLSDSFINENDWEETYESPIEMIVSQMSSEFDRMKENQLMLRVNQAVDFYVDKAELLKALQYDRNQYETGYLDAKKKFKRPKSEWVKINTERVMCRRCTFRHEKWFVNFKFCPNCGADMRERWKNEI